MVSSLDGKYSVTPVASKVACNSPCMLLSRGGVSVSSAGGSKVWLVGLGCGRVFSGYGFVKGVWLGSCDVILLCGLNGWEFGASDGIFLENFVSTLAW